MPSSPVFLPQESQAQPKAFKWLMSVSSPMLLSWQRGLDSIYDVGVSKDNCGQQRGEK